MIDDYTPADWIGWTILALVIGFGATGLYVAIHFIRKWW